MRRSARPMVNSLYYFHQLRHRLQADNLLIESNFFPTEGDAQVDLKIQKIAQAQASVLRHIDFRVQAGSSILVLVGSC